jgi:hypothetical protein
MLDAHSLEYLSSLSGDFASLEEAKSLDEGGVNTSERTLVKTPKSSLCHVNLAGC